MAEVRVLVGQGLDIVAEGLEPIVAARFRELLPSISEWTDVIREKDVQNGRSHDIYHSGDLALMLRAMTERLGSLGFPFSEHFGRRSSTLASELRTVRNEWAHGTNFTPAEAYRALDTAEMLLIEVGASAHAPQVSRLKLAALSGLQAFAHDVDANAASPEPQAESAVSDRPLSVMADSSTADPPALAVAAEQTAVPELSAAAAAEPVTTAKFSVSVVDVLSYAMANSRVPILHELSVIYSGPELRGASVIIEALGPNISLSDPKVLLADFDGTGETHFTDIGFTLDPARMLQVDTQVEGAVVVTLRDAMGGVIGEHRSRVRILSSHQWIAQPMQLGLELIAAHIQPQASEIGALIREASQILESGGSPSALDAYQSGDPERVDAIVRAVYEAMQARAIRYAEPPASWGINGQRVRTPGEVLAGGLGTCLDTAVTFAAALEEIGINSSLWFVPGHVFLGYWRVDSSFDAPADTDASEAINYVGLGNMRVLETTSITLGEDLATAMRRPLGEHLSRGTSHFDGVTDVKQSRLAGILPLPSRSLDETGQVVVREYQVAPVAPALEIGAASARGQVADPRNLPARVTQWKNALLDLSLRNRLIHYTERAGHALSVPRERLSEFEDLINAGTTISLVAADKVPTIEQARGIRLGRDLGDETLTHLLRDRKQVFIDIGEAAYSSRLQALAYKARTIQEETGANNLYLALGTLHWQLDGRDLRSPLILVPVRLVTAARGGAFKIVIDESGESTPNFCLIEKLRVEFGLDLPGLAQPERDESGIDLAATFAATRRTLAAGRVPFTIDESVDLAVLQFAKFRLWKDLDENWEQLAENSLVHHLVHSATEAFRDPVPPAGDAPLDAAIVELPVPADSSQTEAVLEAVSGQTFVLEGPPGTGKSQTITNLLAHAMAQGKKVLFVAEKRAALDVVKQRLEAVGLGSLSLDLHDKGARPVAVREQLSAAIDAAFSSDHTRLLSSRELNASSAATLRRYAERLHEPNAFGYSYYRAQDAMLAAEPGIKALPIPTSFVSTADEAEAAELRSALRELPEIADLALPSPMHPWGFITQPVHERALKEIVSAAQAFDRAFSDVVAAQVDEELLALVTVHEDLTQYAALYRSPRVSLAVVDASRATVDSGQIAQLRADISRLASDVPPWASSIGVECLGGVDASGVHARAVVADRSSFFGRKKRQRSVLAEYGSALRIDPKQIPARQISALTGDVHATATTLSDIVQRSAQLPLRIIPQGWNPLIAPGAEPVLQQLDWVVWLSRTLRGGDPVAKERVTHLRRVFETKPADDRAAAALSACATAWREFERVLQAAEGTASARLQPWAGDQGVLAAWAQTTEGRRFNREPMAFAARHVHFLSKLEPLRKAALHESYAGLVSGAFAADDAAIAFDLGIAQASLREREDAQALGLFDGTTHSRAIQRFTASARDVREELPRWIPEQVIGRRQIDPAYTGGAMGELRRQLTRKRGGMSIRTLFERFESIILQITPCVLMSPESVARFFPARSNMFDVVVFDEASQIRVADAVGAMGRGASVIVVGDSKQMPPTSFAEAQVGGAGDADTAGEAVVDEESILSECVQARVSQKWLSWHYRSQDESLISFSNHTYYDGKLSSFPAPLPVSGGSDHGISLVRVDGHFARSGSGASLRTNEVEARAIVEEVAQRFRGSAAISPSIGIVTFNAQQRARIETLLREHPDERLALALEERDGLFVKNLENVQGDERDTILFSVAFSANEKGVVPLNFGPLTRSGGERRLNVAITRARRQVVLFASFNSTDLRTESTISLGIKHLQAYMELAERGIKRSSLGATVKPQVDRHRSEVAAALRERGYVVREDVGLSEFRVDISVATAAEPDAPVLAILLDGQSWRERRTVADRDGLPSEVLQNLLKWRAVERVWLPEWLKDREGTVQRLVEVIDHAQIAPETAKEPVPIEASARVSAVDHVEQMSSSVASEEFGFERVTLLPPVTPDAVDTANYAHVASRASVPASPAKPATHERLRSFVPWAGGQRGGIDVLDALPGRAATRVVSGVAREIVEAEGPVHVQRLVKLVAESFGLSRVVQSRSARIEACIPGEFLRSERDTFVWPESGLNAFTNARVPGPDERRDIDSVALEEIGNAMIVLLEKSGGMSSDTLVREALALFGGRRITTGIANRLDEALQRAEASGKVSRAGMHWVAN